MKRGVSTRTVFRPYSWGIQWGAYATRSPKKKEKEKGNKVKSMERRKEEGRNGEKRKEERLYFVIINDEINSNYKLDALEFRKISEGAP